MSFGRDLREELAHVETGQDHCRRAETSALLRFGGALRLGGGSAGVGWVTETSSGAAARRLRGSLDLIAKVRPEVEVHQPGGLRHTTSYRVTLAPPAGELLTALGILDARGRPVDAVPQRIWPRRCCTAAYLRGAIMVAGSVGDLRHDPHFELRAPSEAAARSAAQMITKLVDYAASVQEHERGWRVVLKAGPAIGDVLARTGAHDAFLRWDAERLRRDLRQSANRMANADRANLGRSVTAAARQSIAASTLMGSSAWEGLARELQEVALARLANPEASLAELGGLLEPPVGKSAVYRRLAKVISLAQDI